MPNLTSVTGEVRKIQQRTEKTWDWRASAGFGDREVYAFVLDRFDEQGNPLTAITVEMSSKNGFDGVLSEGDAVSLYVKKETAGGAVTADALRNLSAGGTIFGDRKLVKRGKAAVPPRD